MTSPIRFSLLSGGVLNYRLAFASAPIEALNEIVVHGWDTAVAGGRAAFTWREDARRGQQLARTRRTPSPHHAVELAIRLIVASAERWLENARRRSARFAGSWACLIHHVR